MPALAFDMLIGTTLLLARREKTPFDRVEPVSKVPEECWLLSTYYKCSYNPD